MSSRKGTKPGHSSFRKAHSRYRDRSPRRPRSRRFYPRGYRSSNPDTILLGLAAVAVCGVVLVVFLLAVAGRPRDLGADSCATGAVHCAALCDVHPAAVLPAAAARLLTVLTRGAGR